MNRVPRLFPNSTIVCIGGGPSLLAVDVDACRGRAHVIAINDAYRLASWADVLYACDAKWWTWHPEAAAFTGLKYGLAHRQDVFPPTVQQLKNAGSDGLEASPDGLRIGGVSGGANSGYQAINLAVHLGASRIVLLGYDMQPDPAGKQHWFGNHPVQVNSQYGKCVQSFERLVEPLQQIGVVVVNASRQTALTMFPRQPIEAALAGQAVAA